MPAVALVSMPFGDLFSPSLGLSLLQAGLRRQAIETRVHYFTFEFQRRVGRAFYTGIAHGKNPAARHLPGEWIFARALFGRGAVDDRRWVETVLRGAADGAGDDGARPVTAARLTGLRHARRQVEAFLKGCVSSLLRGRPRLVGFTSVFQQHAASLALARRLKQADPSLCIVFGGANCEGPMGAETVRQFPFVDAAVSGEADLVFPDLVRRALAGASLDGLPGVRTPRSATADFEGRRFPSAPSVQDMDALPYPDFGDFFEHWEMSGLGREWRARLFFESSRGCWWGERQHCTFCGLNGQAMAYRSKSARRARDELAQIASAHPGSDVQVVDSILDLRYFDDLLPELAERGPRLELFYETKSNLRKPQVRLLARAGVRSIQPGIESFSDSVLRLMRKGVTGLQNVQLLKWCRELGLRPYWNLLWGFPGEDPQEYARMAERLPWLTHLQPPDTCAGIRLDRFSPNFEQAAERGLVDVGPLRAYHQVYPLAPEAVSNLAYHFTFRYADGRDPRAYARPLLRRVREWRRRHAGSALFLADRGEYAVIVDLRPAAASPLTVLGSDDAALYRACDQVADTRGLAETAGLDAAAVEGRLGALAARGLLLRDGVRWLALAVPLGDYAPEPAAVKALCALVRRAGRARQGGAELELHEAYDAPGLRVAGGRSAPRPERPHLRARDVRRVRADQFRLEGSTLVVQLTALRGTS